MKFRPKLAIKPDLIYLQPSWTKGSRQRSIPITALEQRHVLEHVGKLVKGENSLIPPDRSYVEHLKRFEHLTIQAGLRNTHGLRHHLRSSATTR
jgi:hypothetical protein